MITNLGAFDRIFRLAVGLGLISLYNLAPQLEWATFGLVPLACAFFAWCPLYAVLGLHTNKVGYGKPAQTTAS